MTESPWSLSCVEKDSVLIKRKNQGGMLVLQKIAELTFEEAAEVFNDNVIIARIPSLTDESEMIVTQAGIVRKMLENDNLFRGAVGFIPVELDDRDVVVLLLDYGDEKDLSVWWLHLFFE